MVSFGYFIVLIPILIQLIKSFNFKLSTHNSISYYISSTGTSQTGTSENDPMNFETLKTKTFNAGDKILFKRGDSFYGTFDPSIIQDNSSITLLSSYGDLSKDLPLLSGFKIVSSQSAWSLDSNNIYKVDLTNPSNFEGIKATDSDTNKIGFLEDKNKTKYFNLKFSLGEVQNDYDFYCDGIYLYLKTKGKNPFEELGELKLATRTYLIRPKSFMKIEGLHLRGTGGHGIASGIPDLEHIEISNNIIEDIGGSQLSGNERYGNAIQFYATNIKELIVHHNIIREIYDVAFTIQGSEGSGLNILVTKNVFILNSQDSEIWEDTKATGVYNYSFGDNVSIMPGRGWGYEARPDKYAAAHILFWQYVIPEMVEKTKIYFIKNYVYNPIKIYNIAPQQGTYDFFRDYQSISANNNHYYMNNDTTMILTEYNYQTRQEFIDLFKKDLNTEFFLIDSINQTIVDIAKRSNNVKELRELFVKDEEKKDDDKKGLGAGTIIFIIIVIIGVIGGLGCVFYFIIKPKFLDKKGEGSYVEFR